MVDPSAYWFSLMASSILRICHHNRRGRVLEEMGPKERWIGIWLYDSVLRPHRGQLAAVRQYLNEDDPENGRGVVAPIRGSFVRKLNPRLSVVLPNRNSRWCVSDPLPPSAALPLTEGRI